MYIVWRARIKAFGSTVFPTFPPKSKARPRFFVQGPLRSVGNLCWKSSKRPLRQESWATTARELHIQWPRELE